MFILLTRDITREKIGRTEFDNILTNIFQLHSLYNEGKQG